MKGVLQWCFLGERVESYRIAKRVYVGDCAVQWVSHGRDRLIPCSV